MRWFKSLWKDENGANLAEYVILLVLILAVVVAVVRAFGAQLRTLWETALEAIGG